MSFRQASSNPFQFLPGGMLWVKDNPPVLPPMGTPPPSARPLSTELLEHGVAFCYRGKCLEVIEESENGRNMRFLNTITGQELSLAETVGAIKGGQFPDYEIIMSHGVETPRSKADGSEANNLG